MNAAKFRVIQLMAIGKYCAAGLLLLLALPATAQDTEAAEEEAEQTVATEQDAQQTTPPPPIEEEEIVIEEVVVTGSRLKRSTYTSIAPLQVITARGQQEVGLVDAAAILQSSTASTGQQIDLTFGGFVLDGGPGSSNVNLRGLGSDRTLILLNGRRLAPSGAEGAPSAPNINLVPASLVQQYDLLLDGASTIYGSDAVAGVANIILRKDFDGLELAVFNNNPEQDGGENATFSAVWGKNYDRGFIGVGFEYNKARTIRRGDRRWTAGCDRHREVTDNGDIRTVGLFYAEADNGGYSPNPCKLFPLGARVSITVRLPIIRSNVGSIYYTPGTSNGGWKDFSESSFFGFFPVDSNGDGVSDVNLFDHSTNGLAEHATIFPESEFIGAMAYGEYTLDGEMNITPFFEVLYTRFEASFRGGILQLFPMVPGTNPFNICNPDGLRGVDCGEATDALLTNPQVEQATIDTFNATFEELGLLVGTLGPIGALPIVTVAGDRDNTAVTGDQLRLVTGLRGDLPQLNIGTLENWSFELDLAYSRGKGTSKRKGIRGDRLKLSLDTSIEDPNNPGSYICGVDNDGDGIPDGTDGCVPIDMFAPSLYENLIGNFATQAERDYLFDSRDFETIYTQITASGYIGGTIYQLPAGDVNLGLGIELREDDIDSIPDNIARDGLFFGFFSDGGAVGNKYTREAYTELAVPLLANRFLVTELELNLSARFTKDQYYRAAQTYSIKVGYRPVDSLLLRFTRGTSFRAPNLRENFLLGQTGFLNVFDPCVTPAAAAGGNLADGYDPNLDTRPAEVLANCLADGVDPTMLGDGFATSSVESSAGGALDIKEETSTSTSYGFAFRQPFTSAFDLLVGATYYKIEINNAIIAPSSQFIVNDCYNKVEMNSIFCSRIQRNADGRLSLINRGFINRDNETARGIDFNLTLEKTVTLFERAYDLRLGANLNYNLETSVNFINTRGAPDFEDYVGEFSVPKWQGQYAFSVDYGAYRFTWQTSYLSAVSHDVEFLDPLNDIFNSQSTPPRSDTCLGPGRNDVLCRDVAEADSYITHAASFYYRGDLWTIGGGLRNVFDKSPPLVDSSELTSINNVPIGAGYDINGRNFFFSLERRFP